MSAAALWPPAAVRHPGALARRAGKALAIRLAIRLAITLGALGGVARGQEIRESDLYFSDPANLRRMLEEAARQASGGSADEALAAATRVIDAARAAPSPETDPVLGEALLLRARLRLARRERAAAVADIEEALARDPAMTPGEHDRSAFAALFRATRARAVGRLTVESEPSGAAVTLEGRRLGLTPVANAPVLTGTRHVRLERPGYAPAEREVVVGPKPVRLLVELERRGATFLLVTDTDGARVSIDGVAVGSARRPLGEEADDLVAAYNLPIDPAAPPAIFLWRDAVPGSHDVTLTADCRKPLRRPVEIPEGTDSTTLLPMERTTGALRVEGPAMTSLRVDRVDRGTLPAAPLDLCPGPHLVEATAPPARRTRLTVDVEDGGETRLELRFLPVLALLDDDPVTRRALGRARCFNVVDASGVSGADAVDLDAPGADGDRARELLIAATDAALLAWTGTRDGHRELHLLAAGSRRPDLLDASGPEGLSGAVRALDLPLTLTTPTLGLVTAEVRFLAAPVVVTLAAGGGAERAQVRIGDEVLRVGGRDIDGTRTLDQVIRDLPPGSRVELTLGRPSGAVAVSVVVGRAATDPGFGAGDDDRRPEPNVALARLASPLEGGLATDVPAPLVALARGKAWLALDQPEQARAALADARIAEDDSAGVGPGTLLYYRAAAAVRAGRSQEAREALRQALTHPASRILGPDGPPVLPLVSALLEALEAEAEE